MSVLWFMARNILATPVSVAWRTYLYMRSQGQSERSAFMETFWWFAGGWHARILGGMYDVRAGDVPE